jgi:hypothetical protein
MKKQTRKSIVKKLDIIFSLYIRAIEKKCFVCGSTENLQCGHLFSRVAFSTRWDLMNSHTQCRNCNMRHEYDFEPYRKKFVEKYGQGKYDILYRQHKAPTKYSNNDLLVLIEFYKQCLKKLERNNDKRNNDTI